MEAPIHCRGVVEQCPLHSRLLRRDASSCGTSGSDQRVHPAVHDDCRTLRLATGVVSPHDRRGSRHRTRRRTGGHRGRERFRYEATVGHRRVHRRCHLLRLRLHVRSKPLERPSREARRPGSGSGLVRHTPVVALLPRVRPRAGSSPIVIAPGARSVGGFSAPASPMSSISTSCATLRPRWPVAPRTSLLSSPSLSGSCFLARPCVGASRLVRYSFSLASPSPRTASTVGLFARVPKPGPNELGGQGRAQGPPP